MYFRNIYGSSRVGIEQVNQTMGLNPLYDYLPVNPLVTIPSVDCATNGKWNYEVTSTTGAIVVFNADGYDDVKFTNTHASSTVYSAQTVFNVVPGRTYTVDYDLWAKTNTGDVSCYVVDYSSGASYYGIAGGTSTGHRTITFTVPVNGSNKARLKFVGTKTTAGVSGDMTLSKITINGYGREFDAFLPAARVAQNKGKKRYELANHLGNVLNVVTDRKIPMPTGVSPNQTVASYTANVVSYSDYYPFGQALPYRNGNTPEYRYGYQGSEKDMELKGEGNSYITEFRQLDPRIGRWLSIDPKAASMPWQSPYCSMDNNPIKFNDPLGDEIGKESKGEFNRHLKQTEKRLKKFNKEVAKLNSKDELSTAQSKRLEYLNKSVIELDNAIVELKEMDGDPKLTFHLQQYTAKELEKEGVSGDTRRDGSDIFIRYDGESATLAHELKHGYQHIKGELMQGGYLSDAFDEQESMVRGFAYDETYHNFGNYNNITVPLVYSMYEGTDNDVSPVRLNMDTPSGTVVNFTRAPKSNMIIINSIMAQTFYNYYGYLVRPKYQGGLGLKASQAFPLAHDDVNAMPFKELIKY